MVLSSENPTLLLPLLPAPRSQFYVPLLPYQPVHRYFGKESTRNSSAALYSFHLFLVIWWPAGPAAWRNEVVGFSLKILTIFTADDQREIGSFSQTRKIKAFFHISLATLFSSTSCVYSWLEDHDLEGNCNCRDNPLSTTRHSKGGLMSVWVQTVHQTQLPLRRHSESPPKRGPDNLMCPVILTQHSWQVKEIALRQPKAAYLLGSPEPQKEPRPFKTVCSFKKYILTSQGAPGNTRQKAQTQHC